MKKVINITLGHIVFAIEQDAYDTLSKYLEAVTYALKGTADTGEVLQDIEIALAEKFIARKRSETRAISLKDVTEVTEEMGAPAAFSDDEQQESESAEEKYDENQTTQKKRLFRDTDDAVIAGVASGIAQYFDIDPVMVRVAFLIALFFNGLGLIAYIVLWLVVPKAHTTSEKYAMRGESVTLKDIAARVKKNIADIDTEAVADSARAWVPARNFLEKVFALFGVVVRGALKILQLLAGLVFVIGGALSMAGLVTAYSVILLSDKVLFPQDVQIAVDTLAHNGLGITAMIASFIMMAIPLQVLIIGGASLLAKRNYFTVAKSVSLAVVWIVAVVVAFTASFLQFEVVFAKLTQSGTEVIHDKELFLQIDDRGIQIEIAPEQYKEEVEAIPDIPEIQVTEEIQDVQIIEQ